MEWSQEFPAQRQPEAGQIAGYVATPLWGQLLSHLADSYGAAARTEYSSCSAMPGWNVKLKKGSRALCTLYPQAGYFYAMVSLGRREAEAARFLLPHCTPYTQELYQNTREFNGGRWLMIRIDSPETLADAERLIALRAPAKSK